MLALLVLVVIIVLVVVLARAIISGLGAPAFLNTVAAIIGAIIILIVVAQFFGVPTPNLK